MTRWCVVDRANNREPEDAVNSIDVFGSAASNHSSSGILHSPFLMPNLWSRLMTQERLTALGDASVATGEPHGTISWAAIFAGAVASLALSLVLSTLVAGFGFKLMSPWPGQPTPGGFTPVLGAAMIAVQVVSSALGGYLAGRLRTKWLNLHSHEAHFRDTAHGLLAWAVSTIVGVVLVATVFAMPTDTAAVPGAAPVDPATVAALAQNASNIAAQVAFFIGFGMLLSAFTAAVAAALGGLRREEMYEKYWIEEHVVTRAGPR
jgi:hypothetical protein